MRRIIFIVMSVTFILFLVCACKRDIYNDDVTGISEKTMATNEWIYENMNLYYFWNDQIPADIDYTLENDPEAYFYKLLYEDKDKWSSITDDYASLEAYLNGDPVTMGYYPAFYLAGNNNVIIVVCYVYPGSAADEAGLERGDIILSINNTLMDTTNYYDMYSGLSYSVQLGTIEANSLRNTGESLSLTARTTATDPAICHKVLDIDGYKIGYLVYVEFISGENDAYLQELDNIFNEFKVAGISELIVDLRYNPGGEIDAAVHLASELAPAVVIANKEIMINLQYNDDLQEYLEFYNYTDYLYYKFKNNTSNIDMRHVCFLTTSRSASASELLITGLEPYMDITQIGESTYGKYVGAWVMPDDNEEWGIMPIVTKFSNTEGYTDFTDGLTPDHEIADDLFSALPFGDVSDAMVAKAIELITGKIVTPKKTETKDYEKFKQIVPREMNLKRNLFMPGLSTESD
jgi:carboxyl-terminal processing protease